NASKNHRLRCDIEIDCTNGKAVAWVLRDLANKIEQESLEDGHHDVKVPNGDKVGEVYLDYYVTMKL
ncbi:MAG: hypothetical protein KAS59_02135, partial [Alphaproteobacteria bacterium]|nr:hypothetical protein [Alphaproteobacteria bacterium]